MPPGPPRTLAAKATRPWLFTTAGPMRWNVPPPGAAAPRDHHGRVAAAGEEGEPRCRPIDEVARLIERGAVDGHRAHGARLEHACDNATRAGNEGARPRRRRVEGRREGDLAAVGDGGTGQGAER